MIIVQWNGGAIEALFFKMTALLTRCVRQLILLAFYPILKGLSFTSSLLNARLHRLWRHIVRHRVGR